MANEVMHARGSAGPISSAPAQVKDTFGQLVPAHLEPFLVEGFVFVPLTECKLSAEDQAEWDAAEAEWKARLIK